MLLFNGSDMWQVGVWDYINNVGGWYTLLVGEGGTYRVGESGRYVVLAQPHILTFDGN